MKKSSVLGNVKIHPLLSGEKNRKGEKEKKNPYLSTINNISRNVGPIKFIEPGSIKEKEDENRLKKEIQSLEASLSHELWEEDFINERIIEREEPLWWDLPYIDTNNSNNWLTFLVHRPPLILEENSLSLPPAAPAPLYLTKKEIAKLRRQTRLQKQKEKQEEVLLGLAEAPKDKLRLSSLTRLPFNTGIDVTELELKIRGEEEERKKRHLLQNKERSLNKTNISIVNGKKLQVAIYRILPFSSLIENIIPLKLSLTNGPKQHRLQGLLLEFNQSLQTTTSSKDSFTFLVVEGEEKWHRKYKKKLLLKTKWPKDDFCKLIWEGKPLMNNYFMGGMFSHTSLPGITIRKSNTFDEVKDVLQALKISPLISYWNLARTCSGGASASGGIAGDNGRMESFEFF